MPLLLDDVGAWDVLSGWRRFRRSRWGDRTLGDACHIADIHGGALHAARSTIRTSRVRVARALETLEVHANTSVSGSGNRKFLLGNSRP